MVCVEHSITCIWSLDLKIYTLLQKSKMITKNKHDNEIRGFQNVDVLQCLKYDGL